MWDFLERWFGGSFMPHGHCYLWTPSMVWTQVASNASIGLAYLSISMTLAFLVWRVKLPFSWVYIAFGVFILACGMTHFFDVVTVWHPIYWADAAVRVVTAAASIGTAILIFPLVPKVVAIAKVSEIAKERGERLEEAIRDLVVANGNLRLEQEARARLAAENATFAERARVQEFQERFLAILGHDLRNPLSAIDMGTALLRRSVGEKETKILDRMDSSGRRMSRMIEQILDLTRSRLAGGLELKMADHDLRIGLAHVVDELRVAHPSREFVFRCPRTLHALCDGDRLEQVWSNLVGNAVQHGLPGTPVTVDARQSGSSITVTVHNDGPPIPDDVRSKLFDPFRRGARDSRTAHTSGLGLGLYISHELVVAHGGTLELQTSSLEGTTFRVSLPHPVRSSEMESGSPT